MAQVNPERVTAPARGFNALPVLKQLGLMIGLAASVALGVAVVMWSQTPNYKLLFSNLSDKDAGLVMDALEKSKIEYKVDQNSGSVLVAGTKVNDARLLLASQGLPKGTNAGFESMDDQQGFGVSQFQEKARYHRAMEGELARTISTLANVQSARVHLAIPKQSVFVRDRKKPSASVVVNLYAGRNLEPSQVEAIVHMVSTSVSDLETSQVSVIDQKGRLLSKGVGENDLSLSAGQFDYKRNLEEYYSRRIEELLTPVIGMGGVKAQVVADLDFTTTEQTQESYNPDLPAVRSEQVVEESSSGNGMSASGVPGALPNQPGTQEQGNTRNADEGKSSPRSSSRRSVLNYELDRTISHTKRTAGNLRRLSVAVVVDNKQTVDEAGEVNKQVLTDEELAKIVSLVKDTIGFDAQRGDTVNIINTPFTQQPIPEALPEPPIWEQTWVWDIAKQLVGGVVVLLLIFGVLKPVLGSLAKLGMTAKGSDGGDMIAIPGSMPGMPPTMVTQQAQERQMLNQSYEVNLNTAKQMVAQDPKRVAQVVKSWVGTGGDE